MAHLAETYSRLIQGSTGSIKVERGFLMNRKLVALVGSSLLSVMLLGACNNDDQNPPPEDNDTSEQIDENMVRMTMRQLEMAIMKMIKLKMN